MSGVGDGRRVGRLRPMVRVSVVRSGVRSVRSGSVTDGTVRVRAGGRVGGRAVAGAGATEAYGASRQVSVRQVTGDGAYDGVR